MPTAKLETKSASPDDLAGAFDGFMRAFEAFKDGNDERLAQLEQRMSADVVTTDKVDRINRALDEHKRVVDELALKSARPHLGGPAARSGAALQHKAAFDGYVRKGDAGSLRDLEAKALSVGSDPDGGYLVPDELERAFNRAVKDVSPIRAIAGIRQVSGSVYKKPFAIAGAESGWVAETAVRPETDAPTLAELAFPTMELYAMPAATSALLDDSAVNIDEWIAEEVRDAFAQQEGTAFVTGNGTAKPKGFLDYTKVDNASWSWGNIGFIKTGVDGAFASSNPGDKLIDLVYAVKSGYRANGTFVFNRATQAVSRDLGSPAYVEATHAFTGQGLKPLSPVHVRGARSSGDLAISWVRRTRMGGDNWDAVEVPLAEESERYEIDILDGITLKRTLSSTTPAATYTAAQQTTDFGAPQPSIDLRVYQLSSVFGRGTPQAATL